MNKQLKVAYFSALLILLILVVWYLYKINKNGENLDQPEPPQIYTSGATMRVIGQEFTATNQGDDDRQYNILSDTYDPKVLSARQKDEIREISKREYLVNQTTPPDFWEINPILSQFKDEMLKV
jgi:hypothetical protein